MKIFSEANVKRACNHIVPWTSNNNFEFTLRFWKWRINAQLLIKINDCINISTCTAVRFTMSNSTIQKFLQNIRKYEKKNFLLFVADYRQICLKITVTNKLTCPWPRWVDKESDSDKDRNQTIRDTKIVSDSKTDFIRTRVWIEL